MGRLDSEKPAAIRLSGESIQEEHCYFENNDGKVTLHTIGDAVTVCQGLSKFATKRLIYRGIVLERQTDHTGAGKELRIGTSVSVIYRLSRGTNFGQASGLSWVWHVGQIREHLAYQYSGEHHVFRFNNPEEVRKLRDRAIARSNLSISMSAAELQSEENGTPATTRPDSPSNTGDDPGDVDWNFAKREAAFARLGLDPALDNLPDEELNKLFEKITRVKALRSVGPRPESSLSQADDVWSESGRPIPSDILTDDTSVDAVPSNNDSPEMTGSLKDVQNQLETQRMEFEQRLQAISEYSEADDLKAEKEQMEHQLKLVQLHMKRLLDARARGETDVEAVSFEPQIYTARQLRLIRKVLDKWRAHRSFSMAEVVLSNAVHVKEANVVR